MSTCPFIESSTLARNAGSPAISRTIALSQSSYWATTVGATTSTSASAAVPDGVVSEHRLISSTSVGESQPPVATHLQGIGELRQRSGFTWDKLAELFGVSRRSVHYWASGEPMTSDNEDHLQRCLSVLRRADRGDAVTNRRVLLTADSNGNSPFDLLVQKRYDEALNALGTAADSPPSVRPHVKVPEDRLPPPPQMLTDVRDDIKVRGAEPSCPARVVRRARGA
jgi:DNA-binding transcriptional regulator YiaG